MRFPIDTVIGGGLVLALLLSIAMPALGVGTDYSKLQDTIAIGLVGFLGGKMTGQAASKNSDSKGDQSGQAHEKAGGGAK